MRRLTIPLLLTFNGILLLAGWVLALVAYPRLPEKIPYWLSWNGGAPDMYPRTPLFFLYPFLQVVVFSLLFALAHRRIRRFRHPAKSPIFQEYACLTLIFVNLLFIHIMRNLIEWAHGIGRGADILHFLGLLAVIVMLIPYYRVRLKIAGL
jgi:hypothetical protein